MKAGALIRTPSQFSRRSSTASRASLQSKPPRKGREWPRSSSGSLTVKRPSTLPSFAPPRSRSLETKRGDRRIGGRRDGDVDHEANSVTKIWQHVTAERTSIQSTSSAASSEAQGTASSIEARLAAPPDRLIVWRPCVSAAAPKLAGAFVRRQGMVAVTLLARARPSGGQGFCGRLLAGQSLSQTF
jgi:hypothetical protein